MEPRVKGWVFVFRGGIGCDEVYLLSLTIRRQSQADLCEFKFWSTEWVPGQPELHNSETLSQFKRRAYPKEMV